MAELSPELQDRLDELEKELEVCADQEFPEERFEGTRGDMGCCRLLRGSLVAS